MIVTRLSLTANLYITHQRPSTHNQGKIKAQNPTAALVRLKQSTSPLSLLYLPSSVSSPLSVSLCSLTVSLADEFRSRNFSIYAQWLGVISIFRTSPIPQQPNNSLYRIRNRQYLPRFPPHHLLHHLLVSSYAHKKLLTS